MNRKVLIAILLIAVGVYAFAQYTPGEGDRAGVGEVTGNVVAQGTAVPIDPQKSNFEFEGYAVGKSHIGTFNDWQGKIYRENGQITGVEGTIQANSVNTGIGGLDKHLKSDDFFDVEQFPEITFESTNINQGIMTGILTFRGVEKQLTFPVTLDESVEAEFFLDVTPFNFKYTGVNKEVRLKFDFQQG